MSTDYEPVLVKVIDDYGIPQPGTPDGDRAIAVQAWIALAFVLMGIGGALGLW